MGGTYKEEEEGVLCHLPPVVQMLSALWYLMDLIVPPTTFEAVLGGTTPCSVKESYHLLHRATKSSQPRSEGDHIVINNVMSKYLFFVVSQNKIIQVPG